MKCNGTDLQRQVLVQILKVNHCTEVAKRFRLTREETAASFKSKVPLMSYEDIVTDIQCMMAGNTNILCSGGVTMYAKSSGTTNARSNLLYFWTKCTGPEDHSSLLTLQQLPCPTGRKRSKKWHLSVVRNQW